MAGDPCVLRGEHVGVRIADKDRLVGGHAEPRERGEGAVGRGLARAVGDVADRDRDKIAEEMPTQRLGRFFKLVGHHRHRDPRVFEPCEGGQDAVIGRGHVEAVLDVVGAEGVQHPRGRRRIGARGDGAGDEVGYPVADEGTHLSEGASRHPVRVECDVDRRREVIEGVEQRTVEIEQHRVDRFHSLIPSFFAFFRYRSTFLAD